jgi:hypothetical protein
LRLTEGDATRLDSHLAQGEARFELKGHETVLGGRGKQGLKFLDGARSALLEPSVFRLGLLQDGNIRVSVLPESEEILVGSARLAEGVVL